MKKYLFCCASVLAFAPSAMSGPLMPSDYPHLMLTMADFFGPTMDDFLGRGKDWLSYPTLDVDGNFVLENDFSKPIGGRSSNTLSTDSELFNSLNLAPHLSFLTHLTYAVVNPDLAVQNTFFRGEGLFMEEAYLQYGNDLLTVQAGKFDSDFSVAPSLAPGLYGASIASNYQLNELIGARFAYQLGREIYGSHLLSASVFETDDTIFSQSLFSNRGRTRLATGGPANTIGLDSFTFAYTASDVPLFGKPILNYQLAYLNAAHGEDGSAREQGTAASAWLTIPVEKSTISTIKGRYSSINPLVEYVHLENDGGIRGQNGDYLTAGVDLIRGDYDLAVTGTWHRETIAGNPGTNDYMWQVSIGKQLFGPNGSVVIGYEFSRIGGQPDNTVGIALTFSPNFLERFQIPRGF